jgi:hypothetical protein
MNGPIRIGGASGFWGESAMATPQLLATGNLDYLVYDYLAEITMSIMARARAKEPDMGFATDFVTEALAPNLDAIATQRVKIIANAGGVNPPACARAIRALLEKNNVDLKVAVVCGDDLMPDRDQLAGSNITDMASGEPFPKAAAIASINAYLGATPIAEALRLGADIVVTGRCADSALTLAACMHAFGWASDDWDKLAAGSLAGHLLECGPQATGGNFTDWHDVADSIDTIGYPIAEITADGSITVTKPPGSGGAVSFATVAEQLVYEIEDPQAYILPDVVCDFSNVEISESGTDRVEVAGAVGAPPTGHYKVTATYMDGYRGGMLLSFTGFEAAEKARTYARAAFKRTSRLLQAAGAVPLTETSVEIIGAEDQFGDFAHGCDVREVVLKIAAKHPDARGIAALLRAVTGLALATPAGLAIFHGGRPRPSPVVRLFSFLLPKKRVAASLEIDAVSHPVAVNPGRPFEPAGIQRPEPPGVPDTEVELVTVPLVRLAWARSGDKGNRANIGVIARHARYLPWIWRSLTPEIVAERFGHFLRGEVERFLLPGTGSINFVLHDVLGGGGVASLRNDPQGKSYAQILLATPVPLPVTLLEAPP